MHRRMFVATLLVVSSAPAWAGSIEDAFRGFIERLRGAGQTVQEYRQSSLFQEVRVPELTLRSDKLPLGRGQYALFVTPGCGGCIAAERYLRGQGLNVEVFDVSRSTTAREAYGLVQGQGFPLLLVGSQRMTGWNERLFKEAMVKDIQHQATQMQGQGA